MFCCGPFGTRLSGVSAAAGHTAGLDRAETLGGSGRADGVTAPMAVFPAARTRRPPRMAVFVRGLGRAARASRRAR